MYLLKTGNNAKWCVTTVVTREPRGAAAGGVARYVHLHLRFLQLSELQGETTTLQSAMEEKEREFICRLLPVSGLSLRYVFSL